MDGVWIEPVTAQVMMTFFAAFAMWFPCTSWSLRFR
jgi:hypothetical protein